MRRALLFVPLLLAGCFGECGPRDTVTWRDASLYEALGNTEHRAIATPAGLADGAVLRMVGGVITTLTWRPPARPPDREFAQVRLEEGKLHAQATNDEQARAILARFLAELSVESEETRSRMLDAMVANRTNGVAMYEPTNGSFRTVAWEYSAQPVGDWRVTEALRDLAANASASYAQVGMAHVDVGPYVASVAFAPRSCRVASRRPRTSTCVRWCVEITAALQEGRLARAPRSRGRAIERSRARRRSGA